MRFNQKSYSRLWDGYATDQEAKKARDTEYYKLRKEGREVRRSVLKNQLKKYDGFGIPNGGVCDVYKLTIADDITIY